MVRIKYRWLVLVNPGGTTATIDEQRIIVIPSGNLMYNIYIYIIIYIAMQSGSFMDDFPIGLISCCYVILPKVN